MRNLLKGVIYGLVALVVAVVGGAYLISPVATVERRVTIAQPPERVFAIVGDLRRFNEWSPWFGLDPAAQYSFEGPAEGVGQRMRWSSENPQVGSGTQTVVALVANESVVTDLDFGQMGKATASMSLAPRDGGTEAVWSFRADVNGVMERWMSLMFDRWIGADYEKGLQRLKAVAEGASPPAGG
jgi:uncharacterized protein YndB with AHSA1/START domain